MTKSDRHNSLSTQNLNSLLNGISLLLGGVSRIEISTMIVDEITDDILLPYEAYQEIYAISPSYLEELGIKEKIRDRYLRLRRQLELQYALLLTDKTSILYDERLAPEVTRDLPTLAQDTTPWENLPCRLPPPVNSNYAADNGLLHQLLAEPDFKIILCQLGNIKASLDRQHLKLSTTKNNDYDLIYAQTVIQLDGKIINRYASEIIQHNQQKEIIDLHQKAVAAGTKQWHNFCQFMTKIIQRQQKF